MEGRTLNLFVGAGIFGMGIFLLVGFQPVLTGAVIGTSGGSSLSSVVGIVLLLTSMLLIAVNYGHTATLDRRVGSLDLHEASAHHYHVKSVIGQNHALLKFSKQARKNQEVARDLNHYLQQIQRGNLNAGRGLKHLPHTPVLYGGGAHGGREYFILHGDELVRVGESSKDNQQKVINTLTQIYGRHK